jgi:hypothetical protein
MNDKRFLACVAACIAAVFLAGCGGGGGGGGGGPIGFPLPVAPVPAPGSVVLSGTATYEFVPNASGPLVYAASAPKPVRGAMVEVLDAGTSAVLSTTTTTDSGAYAVPVPANAMISVRVRAQLIRSGPGASWDVTVRDNTRSSALYALQTGTFSSGAAAQVRDLHAPSGWGGSGYTGERAAAPFAILDTVYTAMQKVLSVAPASAFPPLKVFWSPNNAKTGSMINLSAGQIGTTFFWNRDSGREIYVLGKEDADTDEYDSSVVAHEWGHYYQSAFSRDDSMGGEHGQDDRLDHRLAFSEGFGNAWSGIALARRNYVDSLGAGQSDSIGSLNMDLSAGATRMPGWYREPSIQSILWNLDQQVGFKPIHDTLTGFQFRSGAAVTSIHSFAAAFNATAPGSAGALAALLAGQNIAVTNDPYGEAESNSGGIPGTIPLYRRTSVGAPPVQACVSSQAGLGNKLGNYSYVRFTAPDSRSYVVTVSGPPGSAASFEIFRGGSVARNDSTVSLSAGDYVLAVSDLGNPGTQRCFNVSIQ